MKLLILTLLTCLILLTSTGLSSAQDYGACCFVSYCVELEQGECESAGGEWNADYDCISVECPIACVEQMPTLETGYFSDLDCGLDNGIQIVAENFELVDPIEIDRIVFFGGYFPSGDPQNPDCLEIIFRERLGGVPGDEITRISCLSPSRIGLYPDSLLMLHCVVLSDQRIRIEPGDYFLEIYNYTENDPDTWFWDAGLIDADRGLPGYTWTRTFPEEPWTYDSDVEIAFILGGDCSALGIEDDSPLPSSIVLWQNYPNPFNAQTTIQYSLPEQSKVSIDIFDILGRKIETLAEGMKPAGHHEIIWDAENYSSGLFFYRIIAGDYATTKKMLLLK